MPARRRYVRRPRAIPVDQVIEDPIEPQAPPAPEPIPDTVPEPAVETVTPSCAMVEKAWRGYPVWQCKACRVDTLDPKLARCPKGLT